MIISKYIDYLDQMVMYVAGCPNSYILNALKRAGRNFCQDSEVWRTELLIDTIEGTADYVLPLPSNTQLKRIVDAPDVDIGGVRLRGALLSAAYDYKLVFSQARADEQAPSGALYVVSGAGLLDGLSPAGYYVKESETDEYSVYSGYGLDFRLLVDPLAVKVLLQKTSPVEVDGWKLDGQSDPIGDYSAVLGSGAISVAAVSGTELPAPTLRLRVAADATASESLSVFACVIPEHKHDGLPIDLLNQHAAGIMGGALDILLRIPRMPWTDFNAAASFKRDYYTAVSRARRDNLTGRRY